MDKSYFIECITDELNRKGIQDLKDATIDDVASIASEFFGMIEVRGHVFCSINGYLQNIYSCLLDKWFKEAKKHEGVKCSDVPELVSIQKETDEFLEYTKRFLGFEYADGSFVEIEKSVKSVKSVSNKEQNGDNEDEKRDKDDDDPGFHGAWCGLPV